MSLLVTPQQHPHIEGWLADAKSMERASRKIGRKPDQYLKWLSEFIRREDLEDLSARQNATFELRAFRMYYIKAWGGSVNAVCDHELEQSISLSDVPALQGHLRATLDAIQANTFVALPERIVDGVVWVPQRGLLFVTRTPVLSQILAAVAELLREIGPALARCGSPACARLFRKTRSSSVYCSAHCYKAYDNRKRQAKWRDLHRDELSDIRHKRYARATRLKLKNPRARVRRIMRS